MENNNGKLKNLTLWLTGRPCSGKSTLAVHLKKALDERGIKCVNLDGDQVRTRLNSDLGFSQEDRKENLRRIAHVAQLFNENNNMVLATFITPTNELRGMVSGFIENFKLCYVDCSLEEAESRDVKGMYKKARKGEIKDFTGVSAPFDVPESPDICVNTQNKSIEECVKEILAAIGVN